LLLSLGLAACGGSKSSTKPADEFTNALTVGTGLSGFTLVGETTSFSGAPVQVYFRLESADDLGGSAIEIRVEKKTGGAYQASQTFPFANPQSYGHLFLSSFTLSTTGEYRANGVRVSTGATIASREFVVQ
jgi:hypothetical protein